MRMHSYFLAHQIARFGAMTIPQMEFACTGKCSRATVYRILDDLLDQGWIKRMPHIGEAQFLFSPRPSLYSLMYGEEYKRNTGYNEANILHAALVAEAFLTLSRYSFVSGVVTEHEIEPSDISKFCHSRTPDGIIQISNGDHPFELAIEVERSRKTEFRINEILEKYKHTFMRGMPCGGLLIITKEQAVLEAYQSKIAQLPTDIENRCLVVSMNGLTSLNQKYFGELTSCPQSSLEKVATFSHGSPKFSPMISPKPFLNTVTEAPHLEGQSQFSK